MCWIWLRTIFNVEGTTTCPLTMPPEFLWASAPQSPSCTSPVTRKSQHDCEKFIDPYTASKCGSAFSQNGNTKTAAVSASLHAQSGTKTSQDFAMVISTFMKIDKFGTATFSRMSKVHNASFETSSPESEKLSWKIRIWRMERFPLACGLFVIDRLTTVATPSTSLTLEHAVCLSIWAGRMGALAGFGHYLFGKVFL